MSDSPVGCSRDCADIVLAFDRASIGETGGKLAPSGIIVYDPAMLKEHHEGPQFLEVPFIELATQDGGSRIMANTVATGALLGMLGLPLDVYMDVINRQMRKKGDATVEENRKAAEKGRDYAAAHCTQCSFTKAPPGPARMLIDGNAGIGLGAVLSGCGFYSGYPMTPSTGVLLYMAAKAKEYGMVVEQAEDEIAAINMAIGASLRRAARHDCYCRRGLCPHGRRRLAGRDDGDARRDRRRPKARPIDRASHAHRAGRFAFRPALRPRGVPQGAFCAGLARAGRLSDEQGLRPGGKIPDTGLRADGPVPCRLILDIRRDQTAKIVYKDYRLRDDAGTQARHTSGTPSPLPAYRPWRFRAQDRPS